MDLPPRPPMRGIARSAPTHRATHAGIALCIALALAACAAPSTRFDAAAWKSQRGVPEQKNLRNGMAVAAREQLRVGMTREAVVALLGEPDFRKDAGRIDVYAIGASPLGIDPQYLELTYRDGRLASSVLAEA